MKRQGSPRESRAAKQQKIMEEGIPALLGAPVDTKVDPPTRFVYHNTPAWVNYEHLKREGYVVIPFLTARETKLEQDAFKQALTQMTDVFKNPQQMMRDDEKFEYFDTEYKLKSAQAMFVGGGFAALGNPASFHNQFARKLRARIHQHVINMIFKPPLMSHTDLKFEQVIDRMLFRRADQTVSAENWHRDQAKLATVGDDIFGGWINLDLKDDVKNYSGNQIFSAAPGTHNEVGNQNHGFKTIKKKDRGKYNKKRKRIVIPPGHILVFYERLVHEVATNNTENTKKDRFRLFLGWRLTTESTSIIPDLPERLTNRKSLLLKSGQHARMTPRTYISNHGAKGEAWSQKYIKEGLLYTHTFGKDALKSGYSRNIVHEVINEGIDELVPEDELVNFPEYSENEQALYQPNSLDKTKAIDLTPIFKEWKTAGAQTQVTKNMSDKTKKAYTKEKLVINQRKAVREEKKSEAEKKKKKKEEDKKKKKKKKKKTEAEKIVETDPDTTDD